ncbi:hypothetical protein IAR50_007078 [Cryptococcus sp. DSM 104548]
MSDLNQEDSQQSVPPSLNEADPGMEAANWIMSIPQEEIDQIMGQYTTGEGSSNLGGDQAFDNDMAQVLSEEDADLMRVASDAYMRAISAATQSQREEEGGTQERMSELMRIATAASMGVVSAAPAHQAETEQAKHDRISQFMRIMTAASVWAVNTGNDPPASLESLWGTLGSHTAPVEGSTPPADNDSPAGSTSDDDADGESE